VEVIMPAKSHSPRDLVALEDKINSGPDELLKFTKSPTDYLKKAGVELSAEHQRELSETIREMELGPRSFDKITSLAKRRGIGIGISIRIRF
jgi:hypothetical protein